MPSGDIQDFYRQKKRGGRSSAAASKSSAGKKQKTQKSKGRGGGASLGSHSAQPPALVSHGSVHLQDDDLEKQEEILRQFDLNMRYGPCLGISRLARWERAYNLGLNPPKDVETLLREGEVQLECVWDGRV